MSAASATVRSFSGASTVGLRAGLAAGRGGRREARLRRQPYARVAGQPVAAGIDTRRGPRRSSPAIVPRTKRDDSAKGSSRRVSGTRGCDRADVRGRSSILGERSSDRKPAQWGSACCGHMTSSFERRRRRGVQPRRRDAWRTSVNWITSKTAPGRRQRTSRVLVLSPRSDVSPAKTVTKRFCEAAITLGQPDALTLPIARARFTESAKGKLVVRRGRKASGP